MPHRNPFRTLIFSLSKRTFKIEQEEAGQRRQLYRKANLFVQNNATITLDGFENFSVSLDAAYGLSLTLEDANCNVSILSRVPLTIRTSLTIQGECYFKAPQVMNERNIIAQALTIDGACINYGKLYAKELILKRAPGPTQEMTLDNRASIENPPQGKLTITHGRVSNQHAIIQAHACEMSVNTLDNRHGTIRTVADMTLTLIGDVYNQHGWIHCEVGNLSIKNSLGTVYCTSVGKIEAVQGTVLIDSKKIIVDDLSLVRGETATHLKTKEKTRVDSVLNSQEVIIAGKKLNLKGVQSTRRDITIEQSNNQSISFDSPVVSAQDLHVNSPTILNRSSLIAQRHISLGDNKAAAIINAGPVIAQRGSLRIVASKITHKGTQAKLFSYEDMTTVGDDLVLSAPMESMQDNHVYFNVNPNHVIGDQLKARMTLTFHLGGAQVPVEFTSNNTWGSLTFESYSGLTFLADQKAAGNISFTTRNGAVTVGDENHYVTVMAGASLTSTSAVLNLYNGCLFSEYDMDLRTIYGMTLGREIDPVKLKAQEAATAQAIAKKEPAPKSEKAAMKSNRDIHMQATEGEIKWNRLELATDRLTVTANNFENISSDITVRDNVVLAAPTSTHRLLVDKQAGGNRIPWAGWNCHAYYRTQGASESALTPPSTFSIGNELFTSGTMTIFASQVSCKTFDGQAPAIVNFTPFTSYTDSSLCGHKKVDKSHWCHTAHTTNETPVLGKFSIGSELTIITPEVCVSGTLAAHRVEITGIQRGYVGEFNWRVTLAPMVAKPFRSAVPLMDYFKETALYKASPGGDTVFKSIFPSIRDLAPRAPRLVLQQNGTVSYNTGGLRSIFTPEQEVKLLTDLMMGELSRHFLSEELNDSQSILEYLESNSLEYSQQTQRLITDLTQREGALTPLHSSEITSFELNKPCIANAVITFVAEDGTSEEVLCPIVFLPQSLNNARLRDGAGCVFSLGDIKFMGVPGGQLQIRGNIDAQGVVTYQNFESVSRIRNTWTRYQTIVHETKQERMFRNDKTITSSETIAVTELQPGNNTVAKGECYVGVQHIYRSGAVDTLGSEGLIVEGADSFEDQTIIQHQIGPVATQTQRGLLGMSGTTTTSQEVSQRAIGSMLQSEGPVRIQARYGRFDATQFRDAQGRDRQPTFEIEDFHFHELLRTLEAHDIAVAAQRAEQARTGKRKRKQALIKLIASLPASYYLGGVASGWLQSVGVAGAKLVMAQAATMSVLRSVIQGQKTKGMLSNAFKAGALAGMDYGLNNTTLLGSGMIGEVAKNTLRGSAGALAYHTNAFENVVLGESGTATLNMLRKGTVDDFLIQIGSAAFGALAGKTLSDLGNNHGVTLGTSLCARVQTRPCINENVVDQEVNDSEFEAESDTVLLWEAPKHRASSSAVHSVKPKAKGQKTGKLLGQKPNESGKLLLWQAPKHHADRQTSSLIVEQIEDDASFSIPHIPHGYITAVEKKVHHLVHGSGAYLMPKIALVETTIDLYQRATEMSDRHPDMTKTELMTCSLLGAATNTVVNTSGNIAIIGVATEMSIGTGFVGTGLAIGAAMTAFPAVDQVSEAAGDLVQTGCHRTFRAFSSP